MAYTELGLDDAMEALAEMEKRKDAAYLERNQVVAAFARLACILGWEVGVCKTAIEGWSEDWRNCIYIKTSHGQMSWHFHDSQEYLFNSFPKKEIKWDGHTTEIKYARMAEMVSDDCECFDCGQDVRGCHAELKRCDG